MGYLIITKLTVLPMGYNLGTRLLLVSLNFLRKWRERVPLQLMGNLDFLLRTKTSSSTSCPCARMRHGAPSCCKIKSDNLSAHLLPLRRCWLIDHRLRNHMSLFLSEPKKALELKK